MRCCTHSSCIASSTSHLSHPLTPSRYSFLRCWIHGMDTHTPTCIPHTRIHTPPTSVHTSPLRIHKPSQFLAHSHTRYAYTRCELCTYASTPSLNLRYPPTKPDHESQDATPPSLLAILIGRPRSGSSTTGSEITRLLLLHSRGREREDAWV